MKRWKIILPSLAATVSLPLFSFVGCQNNKEPIQKINPHVYFNNGGHGTLSGDLDIEITKGTKWCDLVTEGKIPTPSGIDDWEFAGWHKGETKLEDTDETIINENWSVTAWFELPVEPTEIQLNIDNLSLVIGEKERLFASVLPQRASQEVIWSTDDEEVATIDQYGNIEATGVGEANITAQVKNHDDLTATCDVVVIDDDPVPTQFPVILINSVADGFSIDNDVAVVGETFTGNITASAPMDEQAVDYVLVDGQPITGWTFTREEYDYYSGTLQIPSEKITGKISIHCLKFSYPIPHDFETDPWETIAFYADLGLTYLAYAYDCSPVWFIGKTRQLKINGQTHIVRVVGTNQDTYKVDDVSTPAALTFQFNNLISNKKTGERLCIQWDANDSNQNYWGSSLENALNGQGSVEWKDPNGQIVPVDQQLSVYHMIRASDPANKWTQRIKTVNRTVNTYENEEWTPTEKPQNPPVKLFVPTVSNIFSSTGIQNSTIVTDPDQRNLYSGEGQSSITDRQYSYYQKIIQDEPWNYQYYECLRFGGCSETLSKHWWLSSPNLDREGDEQTKSVCYVDSVGTVKNLSRLTINIEGIAPCFCI